DQRKPWYIQALRPDGSPLTFGENITDLQENNIGVVGQGSRLFIRVDEQYTGINVALNDEQNLFCTITFQQVIDAKKEERGEEKEGRIKGRGGRKGRGEEGRGKRGKGEGRKGGEERGRERGKERRMKGKRTAEKGKKRERGGRGERGKRQKKKG
ncbi:FimD/PapC C-terminal domain-containing protein, partial [Escherichia coli]|uniref:FimD/PapC C-terminal domain-containing protein n=1 Tax=Escherichia coli TaxID=562 RepID=UPI00292DB10A